MAPPLLQLKDIHLSFGGAPLLDAVELSVSPLERVCLVGRNGSGKSTLLRIAAGLVEPDGGSRFVQPGATIRYLPQEPDFGDHATTLSYVEAGLTDGDHAHRARYLLQELGLTGEESPRAISGGEARRAALARVLAPCPDILLLDEPTNHLDLPTIEWLENELDQSRAALVLISHDRRFLSRLSRSTAWLDRGRIRRIERGFTAFENWREEVLTEEERDQHKLDRRIVDEEHWLRYGVSGRRKRNVRRLANLHALRAERRDARRSPGRASLVAAEAEKSGRLVIEAKNIARSYESRRIIDDFSIRIQRGDRLGVIGPNGAGKTTLVNLLIGAIAPDAGELRSGVNIEMATLDQHRESLDPKTTLSEALTGGRGDQVMVGGRPKHVVGYMKDFLFARESRNTPLEVLSGGERGRLMLARALAKPSNLLVLDEPTNDLDLDTLDVLEDMLGDYEGTVILISHDRDFLDRVVTSVIAPEGNGRWVEYAGGYSDMLSQRGADLRRGTTAPLEKKEPKSAPPAPVVAAKRKLSFSEKHALSTLPERIDFLHAEITRLQTLLAAPDLYQRDRNSFDNATTAITAAHDELARAEHRWLELEMLREELEG
ncbi:MAG: ATP-binding cassette domain-containing protein [Alphaproteobacteria bacterium]|nr:ATP-binding cassette domain-containing protein [Alphaproteobacteria bacterium]